MTEEEIDQFVQEKVYGTLLPWEKNPRPKGSCNTFRAQERTLRAIIMLQKYYGSANRNLVMQITGYSRITHQQMMSNLRKKGAIERKCEHKWPPKRRSYKLCANRSQESQDARIKVPAPDLGAALGVHPGEGLR